MRNTIILLLLLGSSVAHALTVDAKALARFDVSYAKCEAQYPQMRGRRDEAYLGLWRLKADANHRAQLNAARKRPEYRQERERALHPTAASAPASPLEHQCQALWTETQRSSPPAK
ncbi:hypothetical protein [Piscinibacter sp. XHJ-5]|uniref:hypothetical protein n=1 Tax=Piscinibacter sp. XHJ-5 TaxID=3037797 RepID=UPI0024536D79|nr:hypothetical protein [Piscinibacter sp. XHJ-5]